VKLLSIWLDEADGILPPQRAVNPQKVCLPDQIRNFALIQRTAAILHVLGCRPLLSSALGAVLGSCMYGHVSMEMEEHDGEPCAWAVATSRERVHESFWVRDAEMLRSMLNG
jgi:hypothetical protein